MNKRFKKVLLPLMMLAGLSLSGCKNTTATSSSPVSSSSKASVPASTSQKVVGITVSGKQDLVIGTKTTLTATVTNAIDTTVTWKSDHADVASVSASGEVEALKNGTATITATSKQDKTKSASILITVSEGVDVSLEGPEWVRATEKKTLTATVIGTTSKELTWSSSSDTIATVKDGVVTGVSKGEVTITATSVADKTKKAEWKMTVTDEYDMDVNANGTFTRNVEDMDLSGFVVRSDAVGKKTKDCIVSYKDNSDKDDVGLAYVGKGTVLTSRFKLESDAVIACSCKMATQDNFFDVDHKIEFKIDGIVVTSANKTTFGGYGSNVNYNWQAANMDTMVLQAGDHTFTYTAKEDGINLRSFAVAATNYGQSYKSGPQITNNGTTLIEAEDIRKEDGTFYDSEEWNPSTHNKSLKGGMIAKDTVLSIPFYIRKDSSLKITAKMAKYEADYDLAANVKFELVYPVSKTENKTIALTPSQTTFGGTGDNLYFNWKDVTLFNQRLNTKGNNAQCELKITALTDNSFPNFDSVSIDTTAYFLNQNLDIWDNGDHNYSAASVCKVHLVGDAENTWFTEDAKEAEPAALADKQSVLAHTSAGGYFEVPFYLHKGGDLTIHCRLAKYEDVIVKDNYSLKLDGQDLAWADQTQRLGQSAANQFHNWKDCAAVKKTVAEGDHTLRFDFVANGVNIDVINFALADILNA
ncbi:MAG: Ig-like domain-containing protein [Bacilli bacterium]|jgi:hypothetical protein|nr:Ig-like domain-containing protein [Bacilli bacterium]